MSKYTPGPWFVKLDPVLSIVCQEDNPVIAELTDLGESAPEDQIFASASLIAAAPDLFEAVITTRQLIADFAVSGFTDGDIGLRLYENQAVLTAALKKAAVA